MVDSVTAGLASDLVQFEKLGTISLKGKAVRVEVYTPLGPAAASVRVVGLHAVQHTLHRMPKLGNLSSDHPPNKTSLVEKVKGTRCHLGGLARHPPNRPIQSRLSRSADK